MEVVCDGVDEPSDFVTEEGDEFWFVANEGSIKLAELVDADEVGIVLVDVESEF